MSIARPAASVTEDRPDASYEKESPWPEESFSPVMRPVLSKTDVLWSGKVSRKPTPSLTRTARNEAGGTNVPPLLFVKTTFAPSSARYTAWLADSATDASKGRLHPGPSRRDSLSVE